MPDLLSRKQAPAVSWPGAGHFLAELRGRFKLAAEAAGGVADRHFSIGGATVRLRFAGAAIREATTSAFEHLEVAEVPEPSLTIHAVDSQSTGEEAPRLPETLRDRLQPGDAWHYKDATMDVLAYSAGYGLGLLERNQSLGYFWATDARQLPQHEWGSPLLRLLHWWMRGRAMQLFHAGAVGTPEGGVLLVGKGGAGKSTSTFACLDSGLLYAGDDYCVVTPDPTPFVHSLYNSGKLNRDSARRFRNLKSDARAPEDDKSLFFMQSCLPEKVSRGFPIRALLLPRPTGEVNTVIREARRAEAFLASAPSTVCQLPGGEQESYHKIGKVLRHVPCYWLEAGTDLGQIPDAILGLLNKG